MTSHPERYLGFALFVLVGSVVVPPALDLWMVTGLPQSVREAVERRFPGGEIARVDTSTRRTGTVYDIHVWHDGNLWSARIASGGRVLGISCQARGADRSSTDVARPDPDRHSPGPGLCRMPG